MLNWSYVIGKVELFIFTNEFEYVSYKFFVNIS